MSGRLIDRVICALTWHLVDHNAIDAWLRGGTPFCPRCGMVRDYGPRPKPVQWPDYEDDDTPPRDEERGR